MAKCKSCNAEIIWIKTPTGKAMPCDAQDVKYWEKPKAKGKVVTQNHLFEMIEKLNDDTLKDEALDQEIKRALVLNELAKTAVANGALMVKCVDALYEKQLRSSSLFSISGSTSNTRGCKYQTIASIWA